MVRTSLPKHLLYIRDCSFILPDDFEGSIEDAFQQFLEYHTKNSKNASVVEDNIFSTFDILLHTDSTKRVCGEYNLYELTDQGKYILKDAIT